MEEIIIPITAILMPLFLVPTIITLRYRHRRRELEHLERMKAMEVQLPVPWGQGSAGSRGVAAIGAGVPAASVLAAFLTSLTWRPMTPGDFPVPAVAWGCAVVISAAALLTSLVLAFMHARAQQQAESAAAIDKGKPVFDPDTFDVVGSRA